MHGLMQDRRDLQGASLEEVRRTLQELITELTYRLSSISKANFGEKDLQELTEIILSDDSNPKRRKAKIRFEDGKIYIEADEINLTGDVFINGSPV